MKPVEDYVRGLGLDAYLVGGAVRDEQLGLESKDADFLVPGVDAETLRARLGRYGDVDDLVVAGRLVGLRLYPNDRLIRTFAPAGIEFAPPRRERSTGPGRHDFEIVTDPGASLEDDLARRDFTVNAMARRLEDGAIIDPFGGRSDLKRRRLRAVSDHSFAEDPLRLVRGLRLVSQLDLEPDAVTLEQMREQAESVRLVSGERIGGGLAADGMGELSKLLLGQHPAKALRLARDTGVLVALLPELEPTIGFEQESRYHDLTVDEHTFEVVQAAADADRPLRVRLAALLHDLGKPHVAWRGRDGELHFYSHDGRPGHEVVGAQLADAALRRVRYSNALRARVVAIVRYHAFEVGRGDAKRARRLLAEHGAALSFDLLEHREADLHGKPNGDDALAALKRFRLVLERERSSPHRLADLEVNGDDLIQLGYQPGPELGRALDRLLADVVGDPSLNRRQWLLDRAKDLQA